MSRLLPRQALVRRLAVGTGLTQAQAAEALDCLGLIVAEHLAVGDVVRLPKLGALRVRQTAAKQGTFAGRPWTKPAGRRVAFSAGTALQRALEVTV
jgi:nucleoid DNA-binding protein